MSHDRPIDDRGTEAQPTGTTTRRGLLIAGTAAVSAATIGLATGQAGADADESALEYDEDATIVGEHDHVLTFSLTNAADRSVIVDAVSLPATEDGPETVVPDEGYPTFAIDSSTSSAWNRDIELPARLELWDADAQALLEPEETAGVFWGGFATDDGEGASITGAELADEIVIEYHHPDVERREDADRRYAFGPDLPDAGGELTSLDRCEDGCGGPVVRDCDDFPCGNGDHERGI